MLKSIMGVLIWLLIAGTSQIAEADHPTVDFGTGIAGPAITVPATTLQKGKGSVSVRVEFVKFDPFSDAELESYASQGSDTHSVDYLITPSIGAAYGITDDLTVGLRLPYVLRGDIREGHLHEDGGAGVHAHGDSDGIGDLTLFGQYRFFNHRSIESALLAGIKMPSGRTGVKDRNGVRFETEHQPGSGSWDPSLGLAVSKGFKNIALDGNVLYTFATRGAQDTNLGDRLNYNLAASYRLGGESGHRHSPSETVHEHLEWDLILEVNGEWQEKQDISGIRDENNGGNHVYISPGLGLYGYGWLSRLSVGVPVVDDTNGFQPDTEIRVFFGISRGF